MNWLWIGVMGIVGVLLRHGSDVICRSWTPLWPAGTFLVNIVGCFLAGCFYVLGQERQIFSETVRLALMTGFCGGFTTFSAYAVQSLALWETQVPWMALSYFLLSPVLGLMAAGLGIWVAR